MRAWIGVIVLLGVVSPAPSAASEDVLRFAWPSRGEAIVELTDEREVGGDARSVVIEMRLHVEPDAGSDRVVLSFSDARIVSVDHLEVARADPAGIRVAVARVMKRATPAIVVDREGRFVEARDTERVAREVLAAAGFPGFPSGLESVKGLVRDVAREDWSAWVGSWLGPGLEPGEWTRTESEWDLEGERVAVRATRRGLPSDGAAGRTRLQASATYPSEAVRRYTSGFLVDMARDAKELGNDDTVLSARFLERAQFGPVTETVTVELETATMRPHFAERTRTFSAVARGHWVSGSERRAHRFTWSPDPGAR